MILGVVYYKWVSLSCVWSSTWLFVGVPFFVSLKWERKKNYLYFNSLFVDYYAHQSQQTLSSSSSFTGFISKWTSFLFDSLTGGLITEPHLFDIKLPSIMEYFTPTQWRADAWCSGAPSSLFLVKSCHWNLF